MDVCLLQKVRDQAAERLSGGEEPPWVWFRLMKLQEALDQVLSDLDSPMPQTENSQRLAQRWGTHLQLADSKCPQDSVQSRRDQPELLPRPK